MRIYPTADSSPSKETNNDEEVARFYVLYAKVSTRKHRKWEGDGILICYKKSAVLKSDDEATVISRSTGIKRIDELVSGFILKMGGLEVEIQDPIEPSAPKPVVIPPPSNSTPFRQSNFMGASKLTLKRPAENMSDKPEAKRFSKSFVCPLRTSSSDKSESENKKPETLATASPKENDPVIAPFFIKHLRQHQKEGVEFIYRKLLNAPGGIILADEMGLGKSVQTLASLYSLMGNRLPPSTSIRRCLLVVPSSLVNNWKAEFKKWFGTHRLPVIAVKSLADVRTYTAAFKYSPFLLISYDMALRMRETLFKIEFDAIICDEGHRLKSMTGKLRNMLANVPISRRLLLTGTPVQNDIDEFYSLLDFVRPGAFGSIAEFRKECSENRTNLSELVDDTILRRTGEVNRSNLPPKHEYVIFCKAMSLQKSISSKLCDYMTGEPLIVIDYMRKLSNHPALLYKKLADKIAEEPAVNSLLSAFPKDFGEKPAALKDSGKIKVLSDMLAQFRILGECTVVVSNFTKTLDMISGLCGSIGFHILRLDGSIAVKQRQPLVDKFNKERNPNNVFLLSTKAGGVGLNLIAASRLILFDSDWNPASDLQAMGRIWRDGQKKPCHIYRLCTAGSIDEKMLQRQVKKTGLSSMLGVAFDASNNVKFSDEDLMDIFTVSDSDCNTHDLLECDCQGNGQLPTETEEESTDLDIAPDSPDIFASDSDENLLEPAIESIEAPDVPEESIEPPGTVSMAELFSWRHFSPSSSSAWENFLKTSGLKNSEMLTFAFYLTSQF